MEAVVFHLTDYDPNYGIPSPQNHINEWIQICQAFGVSRIIIIDQTQFKLGRYYTNNIFGLDLEVFNSLEECYASCNMDNSTWVFFESKESIQNFSSNIHSLKSLEHPENVFYVFGPDFGALMIPEYKNSKLVYIESYGNFPLYAKCAASIVLHDRVIKDGS